jgi:hypothetical protein
VAVWSFLWIFNNLDHILIMNFPVPTCLDGTPDSFRCAFFILRRTLIHSGIRCRMLHGNARVYWHYRQGPGLHTGMGIARVCTP